MYYKHLLLLQEHGKELVLHSMIQEKNVQMYHTPVIILVLMQVTILVTIQVHIQHSIQDVR